MSEAENEKNIHVDLNGSCYFFFPGNGRAEDAFSLYGVSLDSTYDQVLTNGLERGYKVNCTFIPSAFSKKIPKDMFFFHNYFEVYDSLKKFPILKSLLMRMS